MNNKNSEKLDKVFECMETRSIDARIRMARLSMLLSIIGVVLSIVALVLSYIPFKNIKPTQPSVHVETTSEQEVKRE